MSLRCQVLVPLMFVCGMFLAACGTSPQQAEQPTVGASPEPAPTPSATAAPTEPSLTEDQPALTWEREGGIAGFCDKLVIYPSGLVQAFTCRAEDEAEPLWEAQLSREAITQVGRWQVEWTSVERAWTDDATADSMTERIQFVGQGGQTPGETDLLQLRDFAVKEFLTQQP